MFILLTGATYQPGRTALFAAARGTTTAGTCVPPCVTTTTPTTAITTLASALSQLTAECRSANNLRGPALCPVLYDLLDYHRGEKKRAGT